MAWWQWVVLGTFVLGAEAIIDTEFYLVFIGLAAIAVGLNNLAPLHPPAWGQWLLFSGLAVGSILLFRQRLYEKIRASVPGVPEGVAGERVEVEEPIPARGSGTVVMRGAEWAADNESDQPIPAGGRVEVLRSEGVRLIVRPALATPSRAASGEPTSNTDERRDQ